jgi:hypothetical protein
MNGQCSQRRYELASMVLPDRYDAEVGVVVTHTRSAQLVVPVMLL